MYTLLVTGDVPGASTYFNPLLQQTIIPCTSGTRPTGVHNGMTIFETDTGCYMRYNGSAWKRTGAFDVESVGTGSANETTTLSGVTTGVFAAGSPVCGHNFIAPPSGGVYVTVSGRIMQTNNTQEVLLGWEMRTGGTVGSGTVVITASTFRTLVAGRAVNTGANALASGSRRYRVQAGTLTPGSTYNVQTMHLVSGGSATIEYRELIVEPVL